ncbi:MAG: nucleotide sugar dehydrogenase [Candidatus Omnitrophica bacterium]|jgi:UDP-N-acetyl-D-glucosamine dehydrogenase|nr:nucleotide sugar dehydrogenase [Candidatus Omnitrophota bacterium]MDD5661108.1 nucleotide sugar dehydrogenase [Candidatus Omnitrophota bacterium]
MSKSKLLRDIRKKIKNKKLKIAVIGLGYVGFPLALEFAKKGVKVVGIEIDRDRLSSIARRSSYISDITNNELRHVLAGGNFRASGNFAGIKDADAVLICVPTPLKGRNLPDISFIRNAVKEVALHIKKQALVVLESTTFPGTTEEEILPIFEKSGFRHEEDFFLCFSPERIDPGNKKFPVQKIPKVMGGLSQQATQLAMEVYHIIIKQVVPVSSARAAETVKLLENTFRLINIGLIDELSMMAHKMKIDIWEVIQAASTKPFGFMPFYPGPGVGGHCIPKDPLYLHWKAKSFGFHSRFIKLASDLISYMPQYVVKRVKCALLRRSGGLKGSKILVIGVTYKRDTKDLRKSPSIDVINCLKKQGAIVSYFDPIIPFLKIKGIDLESVKLNDKKIKEFDCVIIATDHSAVDYSRLLENARFIFDTRNVFKGKYAQKVERL